MPFCLSRCTRALSRLVLAGAPLVCIAANPDEPPRPPIDLTGPFGTAYLKTRNTVHFANKPYGLGRNAAQGLLDICNDMRKGFYHLQPVSPPESTLASLDTSIHEKYLDTNKALTVVTSSLLTLPDLERWKADLKTHAPQYPAKPPDCIDKLVERRHATLWRDGKVYELRYDTRKAVERPAFVPHHDQRLFQAFLDAPIERELGLKCRRVVGPDELAARGHACMWDLFPYAIHLNWPFALSGRVQFGPAPGMFETIEPISANHGHTIPASVFEIPKGFKVVPLGTRPDLDRQRSRRKAPP